MGPRMTLITIPETRYSLLEKKKYKETFQNLRSVICECIACSRTSQFGNSARALIVWLIKFCEAAAKNLQIDPQII